MDLAHRVRELRVRLRLPLRARTLPIGARLGPAARRRLGGIALISFSLTLGAWAFDGARLQALASWERDHPPSQRIWEHALASRGLRPAPEKSRANQASRSLPARLEIEGTAWVSSDRNWVAVFGPPTAEAPFALYCRDCGKPVLGWDSPGGSWGGFETALAWLESKPNAPQPHRSKRTEGDSREILY